LNDAKSLIASTRQNLEHCLREHDRAGAVRSIIGAVDAGLPIENLYAAVLQPFLVSVGRGWQQGQTAVWEEHLIAGAVRAAVEALYPRVLERKKAVPAVAVTVAFFCPPEESHDLALRMLADRFDLRGFRTVYVGAATPVEEMVKCVRTERAGVVCLSASTHFQKVALHNVIAELQARLPEVRLIAGGPAFAHGAPGWDAYTADDVDELLDELAGQVAAAGGGAAAAGAAAGPAAGGPGAKEQGHA